MSKSKQKSKSKAKQQQKQKQKRIHKQVQRAVRALDSFHRHVEAFCAEAMMGLHEQAVTLTYLDSELIGVEFVVLDGEADPATFEVGLGNGIELAGSIRHEVHVLACEDAVLSLEAIAAGIRMGIDPANMRSTISNFVCSSDYRETYRRFEENFKFAEIVARL